MAGKHITRRIRIDDEMDMRVRELAEMMGVSQSAIIRVLMKHSIEQIYDRQYELSKAKAQQEAT